MGGADISPKRVRGGLDAAQALQASYDEVGWQIGGSSHEKLRHLSLHLAKTVGLIAALSEQLDHSASDGSPPTDGEVAEKLKAMSGRVADLTCFAAQISTLADASLGELFISRLRENAERFAPNSDISKTLGAAAGTD
jgi:hypothetical protein